MMRSIRPCRERVARHAQYPMRIDEVSRLGQRSSPVNSGSEPPVGLRRQALNPPATLQARHRADGSDRPRTGFERAGRAIASAHDRRSPAVLRRPIRRPFSHRSVSVPRLFTSNRHPPADTRNRRPPSKVSKGALPSSCTPVRRIPRDDPASLGVHFETCLSHPPGGCPFPEVPVSLNVIGQAHRGARTRASIVVLSESGLATAPVWVSTLKGAWPIGCGQSVGVGVLFGFSSGCGWHALTPGPGWPWPMLAVAPRAGPYPLRPVERNVCSHLDPSSP